MSYVSDTAGLTWNLRQSWSPKQSRFINCYWAYSGDKLTNDLVTVHNNGVWYCNWTLDIVAVSGVANPSWPFDSNPACIAMNYANSVAPNVATTISGSNDLVLSFATTESADYSYTITPVSGMLINARATPAPSCAAEYQKLSSGTYNTTFSLNSPTDWIAVTDALVGTQPRSVTLTPSSGPVGSTVTVSGSNFAANSSLSASFNGLAVSLSGSHTTDSSGNVPSGMSFTVPASTVGGKQVLITDASSNAGLATFTVNSNIILNPTSGNVGSTVTVIATGMAVSHSVTATFGSTPVTLSSSITDANGGLTATFTVPASTAGSHTFTLTDTINSPTATFTTTPSIIPSPPSGNVGSSVVVIGRGFAALSSVTVKYGLNTLWSGASGTDGSFTSSAFSFPSAPAGGNTLTGSDGTNNANATFTVIPSIKLNPTSGYAGNSTTVTGSGFAANSPTITIKYNGVTQPTNPSTVTSNSTGGFSATFSIPTSGAGNNTVQATDASSNSASANFTVFLPLGIDGNGMYAGNARYTGCTITTQNSGDVLYLVIVTDYGSTITVSDGASLSWTLRKSWASQYIPNYCSIYCYWAYSSSKLTNDYVQVYQNGYGSSNWAWAVIAVSGVSNPSSPFDSNAACIAMNHANSITPTVPTTISGSNDLVLSFATTFWSSHTITQGSGKLIGNINGQTPSCAAEYQILSSGTYATTFSLDSSDNWIAITDAFDPPSYPATFQQSCLGSDASATVVTINNTAETCNQLSNVTTVSSGNSLMFSYASTVSSSTSSKQYVLTGVNVTSPLTKRARYYKQHEHHRYGQDSI